MHRNLILASALLFAACAPRGAGSAGLMADGYPRLADPNAVITAREIATFPGTDAYHLIRYARPLWLHSRAPAAGGIPVYARGMDIGGLQRLRTFPLTGLTRVVYHDAARATLRFGVGHPNGAIELIYDPWARGDAARPGLQSGELPDPRERRVRGRGSGGA